MITTFLPTSKIPPSNTCNTC